MGCLSLSPIYTTYCFNHEHYEVHMNGQKLEDWLHIMENGVEIFEHDWRTGDRLPGNPVVLLQGKWEIVCIGDPSQLITPPIVSKSSIKFDRRKIGGKYYNLPRIKLETLDGHLIT